MVDAQKCWCSPRLPPLLTATDPGDKSLRSLGSCAPSLLSRSAMPRTGRKSFVPHVCSRRAAAKNGGENWEPGSCSPGKWRDQTLRTGRQRRSPKTLNGGAGRRREEAGKGLGGQAGAWSLDSGAGDPWHLDPASAPWGSCISLHFSDGEAEPPRRVRTQQLSRLAWLEGPALLLTR